MTPKTEEISLKPFADVFGVTSRLGLGEWPTLDELAALPVADLAQQLHELSGHHLREPLDNAGKLHQVAQESFRLPTALVLPVQRVLSAAYWWWRDYCSDCSKESKR